MREGSKTNPVEDIIIATKKALERFGMDIANEHDRMRLKEHTNIFARELRKHPRMEDYIQMWCDENGYDTIHNVTGGFDLVATIDHINRNQHFKTGLDPWRRYMLSHLSRIAFFPEDLLL